MRCLSALPAAAAVVAVVALAVALRVVALLQLVRLSPGWRDTSNLEQGRLNGTIAIRLEACSVVPFFLQFSSQ